MKGPSGDDCRGAASNDLRCQFRDQVGNSLLERDIKGKAPFFGGTLKANYALWKLDAEGWEKGMSLKDVEQAIKGKTEEKLKVYNFLRPAKREEIQGQIEYLRQMKKEVQKQPATKEVRRSMRLFFDNVRLALSRLSAPTQSATEYAPGLFVFDEAGGILSED